MMGDPLLMMSLPEDPELAPHLENPKVMAAVQKVAVAVAPVCVCVCVCGCLCVGVCVCVCLCVGVSFSHSV